MTPTDALKLVRQIGDPFADESHCVDLVLGAINDALERAAKSLEAEDKYTWAAPHVRSLKQPVE